MLNLSRPDSDRWWSLPNFVFMTYTLFLAGFYFVPNAVDNYKFYIALVFLPSLLLIPTVLDKVKGSAILLSLLTYLGYMLLSSLWSDNFDATILWRDILYTAYILSFILLTLYFFRRNPLLPDAIMRGVALVVIVAAAVSILTYEENFLRPVLAENRLIGLGTMDNANPSAFIYGFFAVIALSYARRHRGHKLAYVYTAGVFVILLYVILTQSNTGLLALLTACALLFFAERRRRASSALLPGIALSLTSAAYLAWSLGLTGNITDLGFLSRLPIWQHTLEQWRTAPVFGQGYQQTIVLAANGNPSILNYAHSLFLGTLRDGGMVGLGLLLLVYFFSLRSAVEMAFTEHNALYLSLFVFGLICVLVDTDQIVTRPRELWIILWLPLACLVAYEVGLTGEGYQDSLITRPEDSPKNI